MSETASTQPWRASPPAVLPARARTSRAALAPVAPYVWVGLAIGAVAITSLIFFYTHGLTNLCGDAIAHMEGARRLWDSRTPGYEEIGSVWLPVFHILVAPLTLSDFLWRSGLGGSLVSTAVFAISAWMLFRLAMEMNRSLASGLAALGVFLLCPTILYLASTPLTEPRALMWSVLLVYWLFRYDCEGCLRLLVAAAVAAFLGTLTRYDGWNVLPFAALFVLYTTCGSWRLRIGRAALFSLISGSGPLLWIAHNHHRYGNALEFYNGPFSARAIYAHQLATTGFPYTTDGSFLLSARYYLEDLKLIIGAWPLMLAVLGFILWTLDGSARRRRAGVLLFLVSLPFYIQAMAHAAVPLYVPTLFPHTYYNLRYGIEMLPAVAVLCSFLVSSRLSARLRTAVLIGILTATVYQAFGMIRHGARELAIAKESILNTPCRSTRQGAVAEFLRGHYDGQTILMAAGRWPCVMPETGIAYRRTITENNRRYWRDAASRPEEWVEWIIRADGDPVDLIMRSHPGSFSNYRLVYGGQTAGEEAFSIYRLARHER